MGVRRGRTCSCKQRGLLHEAEVRTPPALHFLPRRLLRRMGYGGPARDGRYRQHADSLVPGMSPSPHVEDEPACEPRALTHYPFNRSMGAQWALDASDGVTSKPQSSGVETQNVCHGLHDRGPRKGARAARRNGQARLNTSGDHELVHRQVEQQCHSGSKTRRHVASPYPPCGQGPRRCAA